MATPYICVLKCCEPTVVFLQVEGDLEIIPVVEYCKSNSMTIWLSLIYAYKGMLLVRILSLFFFGVRLDER